jgi:hypothetical protein
MKDSFKIKSKLAKNVNSDPKDVLLTKEVLYKLGHYKIPDYGLTVYPDKQLFEGIGKFQKDNGLPITQSLDPGDDTETEIAGRSPIMRCTKCGAPHAGVKGKLCPQCYGKLFGPIFG